MKRILKLLLSLPFLLVLGTLGIYALGGFVVAPWWIKRELPQILKTQLNATGTVGDISVNPFKFTVDVRDFALTEFAGAQPAIAFDRLFVDFEAGSVFQRAWTFAAITLERPRFNLEADANGALNLAKFAPKDASPKKESPSALPRLLLQKLVLKQGRVTFTDKAIATPATAKLEPIEFELHDLSTLPDQRGEYTLSARLPAGGTLGWRGTVSLAPIASAGQIELKALKLATLWQFAQDKLLIDEPGGSAELSLQYNARYAASRLDAAAGNMALRLSEITLRQKGAAEPALTAGEAALTGGTFSFAERKIQFAELALRKAVVNTVIDADGKTNWAQLAAPPHRTSAAAEARPAAGAPWQAAIDAVNISDVRLRAVDQGFVRPIAADIARTSLRASVKASVGAETVASIEGIAIDVEEIRVSEAGAKDSLMTLAGARLSGGSFELSRKKFFADAVKISKPATHIIRDADGAINLARAFARKPAKPPEPSTVTAEIRLIELIDGAVSFQDRGNEPALALDLQAIRVTARNVSSAAKGAVAFDAALQIKQGGTLRVQGSASPGQQRVTLKLEARNISLTPLAAVVAKHTTLRLASGAAHATGQLDWSGQGKAAGIRYAGSAGLDDFRLDQESNNEPLIAWKGLLAEGIQVDSAKRLARIDDVRLSAPSGKIAIAKDHSTNFAGIMRAPAAAQTGTAGRDSAPAAQAAGDPPFNVNVERIHVGNGELDFSDQSLVLPFGAVIREFTGTVTGLSTQPGTRAGLKLEGRVDEFGQAQVHGTINLSDPKAFTDITVLFRNVAMPPLSPYSATFAGRRIASGKLSLDLQYKLVNSQLLGENKVLLEQFTLGERVESPTAVNLPLDLAIALLTDSSGKIDLSVPVRGNVDNPEFAYGPLVWQAIRTVLTSIVTAPFRALASLFGGSAEKVDAIGFEAGRALLAPPEREKLTRIAGVLKQRPQLRLMIEGRYDPRHDGAALRTAAAQRTLAERQGIKFASADDPALVNFDNAKTQRTIEDLLEERAGKDSIEKFKADYEKTSGKEARRVNPVLALIGRGSTDREFYEALFKRAAELQPLADAALQTLATQRSSAIVSFMTTTAGLDASRIAAKPAASVSADKSTEITTALSLDAGK